MKRALTVRTAMWVVLAAAAIFSLTARAGAVQGDKKFRLLDDCEPISFNQTFGDGICTGNGHTTAQEFLAELQATQDAHKWRNQPSEALLNVGRPTLIENRGGENHTFTPVAEFGGGFIVPLNILSGNPDPAPECLGAGVVVIPPGGVEVGPTAGSSDLPVGTHKFQCCIHPWMRTVIEVQEPGGQANPNKPETPASQHAHH